MDSSSDYSSELTSDDERGSAYHLGMWKPESVLNKKSENFNCIIIGASRSGKSVLLRHLYLEYMSKMGFNFIVIFSESLLDGAMEYIDTPFKYIAWDPEIIYSLSQAQTKLVKSGRKPLKCLLIFDDVMDERIKSDDVLKKCWTLGRHLPLNTSIIWLAQSLTQLPAIGRRQVNMLILFKSRTSEAARKIRDEFLDGVVTEKDMQRADTRSVKTFCDRLVDRNTDDYHCFVIDYLSRTSELGVKNYCYRFKAKLKPKKARIRAKKDVLEDELFADMPGPDEQLAFGN
jgi:hypothetical protein